jgi:hypothetical protein
MRIILGLLLFVLSQMNGFTQKNCIIKGDLKIRSVGKGMSCGMQSNISDFRQVKMIVNHRDTLYTLLTDSGTFEFPAIRKTDNFEIRFTYSSTNEYLIQRTIFFAQNSKKERFEIQHKNELGAPLLSNYSIIENNSATTVHLNYALYCLLNEPYEPAGLKLYDFPVSEHYFMEFNFQNRRSVQTKHPMKGFAHIIPYFSFTINNQNLLPIYSGFYFLNTNIQLPTGTCKSTDINWELPCGLDNVVNDIHQSLKTLNPTMQRITIGQSPGNRYFKPQILLEIVGDLELKETKKQELSVEQPTQLIFMVKNNTKKDIVVRHNGHSGKYAIQLNAQEIVVKKNQLIEMTNVAFSMNNPKNYAAKIWLPEFPNTLFSKMSILYGKKRLPLQLDLEWTVEQLEQKMIYLLEIKL